MARTAIVGGLIGLAVGVFVEIIAVVVVSVLAFIQGGRVEIPGFYMAEAVERDGLRELQFLLTPLGFVVGLIVVIVVFAVGAVYTRRSRTRTS